MVVTKKQQSKAKSRKIGRDASTGKFIPVKEAENRKKTSVVETFKTKTSYRQGESSRGTSRCKPVHTTRAASGAAIIKTLKIKVSDVVSVREMVKGETTKSKKTSTKK